MKNIKWPFLGFAIMAAAGIMGIGVSIGERSWLGVFFSIIFIVFTMGLGFTTKKKMRERGKL